MPIVALEADLKAALPDSPLRAAFQLLLLTAAAAAANYAQFVLSPIQESIRIDLGLNDNQMALLQGPAIALPLIIGGIPLGLLVDRRSRAGLVCLFLILAVSGSVLTALASSLGGLFAARSLVGLAVPAVSTAALSMIADLYPPAQRGRAFMVLAMGQLAGMSGAFALGGVLLARFGTGPDGWRVVTLWLTAPLALIAIAMRVAREPVRREVGIKNASTRAALMELWQYRNVITPLLAGLIVVSIVNAAVVIWAVPTFSRNFGLRSDRIGAIMATALLVGGLVGPVAGGLLVDFCQRTGGPRRTLAVLSGLTFLCVPAALFAVMPSITSATIFLIVFITLGTMISVMASPMCTVVVPNELRGLCIALLGAVSAPLCLGLAPMIVSVLSGAMGGPAMIGKALTLVCVVIGVLGGAMFAFGRRYFPSGVNP